MSQTKHFIVFQRREGHCATWLVGAASLNEALMKYFVQIDGSVEILNDGSIRTQGWGNIPVVYESPLECIESELKSSDGIWGNSWEIRELQDQHWQADFAEVFCSADPSEIANHIRLCQPLFHKEFPHSRARAFVWYLNSGPLVSFHRRKKKRCRSPIEVLRRYHLPWKTWPKVTEWHGSHDDILEQMAIEYPLPEVGSL